MSKNWYVIHTYSGYENKVKTDLERRIESMGMQDRIFQVLVPETDQVELRNGKRQTVARRMYPGYVLVEMDYTPESFFVVRHTPAVTGFVGSGNDPLPLSDAEVTKILGRTVEEEPTIKVRFYKSEPVRIIEGPFAELIGTVDDVNPQRAKLRVLVEIFGRETPVELDFLQVEKL